MENRDIITLFLTTLAFILCWLGIIMEIKVRS